MDADAVADTFAARITPRLVNLATGELLDKDPGKFNQAQALKDPQQSIALDASQDPAGIKRRSNRRKFIWCATRSRRLSRWYCRSTAMACGR